MQLVKVFCLLVAVFITPAWAEVQVEIGGLNQPYTEAIFTGTGTYAEVSENDVLGSFGLCGGIGMVDLLYEGQYVKLTTTHVSFTRTYAQWERLIIQPRLGVAYREESRMLERLEPGRALSLQLGLRIAVPLGGPVDIAAQAHLPVGIYKKHSDTIGNVVPRFGWRAGVVIHFPMKQENQQQQESARRNASPNRPPATALSEYEVADGENWEIDGHGRDTELTRRVLPVVKPDSDLADLEVGNKLISVSLSESTASKFATSSSWVEDAVEIVQLQLIRDGRLAKNVSSIKIGHKGYNPTYRLARNVQWQSPDGYSSDLFFDVRRVDYVTFQDQLDPDLEAQLRGQLQTHCHSSETDRYISALAQLSGLTQIGSNDHRLTSDLIAVPLIQPNHGQRLPSGTQIPRTGVIDQLLPAAVIPERVESILDRFHTMSHGEPVALLHRPIRVFGSEIGHLRFAAAFEVIIPQQDGPSRVVTGLHLFVIELAGDRWTLADQHLISLERYDLSLETLCDRLIHDHDLRKSCLLPFDHRSVKTTASTAIGR